MKIAASAISAVLLALAFPKFSLGWLAWVALAPFFFALGRVKGWKEALVCGGIFGIIFFGINLFWITSLFRFVSGWAILGWAALVLYQTCFILIFVILSCFLRSAFCARLSNLEYLLIPLLWVLIEWLRAAGPFGVTAGDLGYSQAGFLPIIQIASLASVYGVSFLVALVNASIALWKGLVVSLLIVAGAFAWGTGEINNHCQVQSIPVKIALIQPNIDQMDKTDPEKRLPIFAMHEKMTRQALRQKPEIIIWPETAIFTYLTRDPQLFPRVKQLAIDARAWLIIGTPYYASSGRAFNAMVSISPSGEVLSRYDKRQLVPFGEYLPFRKLLFPMLRAVGYYDNEFNPGAGPVLFSAGGAKIAPAICFESVFPGLIRKRVQRDTAFILTITNDAWFGDSAAPYAHLDAGIFRAVENRKYFIQVGNTGFSAVIDPFGRIIARSKLNQQQFLVIGLKGKGPR